MRWRRVIVWAVAAIAVVVVGWAVFRDREPSYKGKTLSQWMAQTGAGTTRAEREPAVEALQHIGTNGLPWVLKWLRYEEPAWRISAYRVIGKLPNAFKSSRFIAWITASEGRQRAWLAAQTIQSLGSDAGAAAIPELSRILNDADAEESGYRAALALVTLGRESLPAMLSALSNPTNPQRSMIVSMIPEIPELGTNGRPAVPVLLDCVRQDDLRLKSAAFRTLAILRLEPEVVVPLLVGELTNRNHDIRSASARALAGFGGDARAAVRALSEALADPDADVRGAATAALGEIAPGELEKEKKTKMQRDD